MIHHNFSSQFQLVYWLKDALKTPSSINLLEHKRNKSNFNVIFDIKYNSLPPCLNLI